VRVRRRRSFGETGTLNASVTGFGIDMSGRGLASVLRRVSTATAARALALGGLRWDALCVYAIALDAFEPIGGSPEGVTVAVETVADAPDVPAETTSATPADLVAVASADHSTDEPAVESTDGPVRGSTEEPTVDSTESEILGWAFARVDSPVRVEECVRPLAFKGAYLWGLFVEPRARSRGVGAALAGALTDAVARDRYGSAFALVDRSNARSRRVFERVGYRCVDETVRVTVGGRRLPTGVVLGARTYANTD